MMIVAAFECRSETETVFTTATFESKQMNRVALGEFALAILSTQMDALRRLLDTTDLSMKQFRWALIPAIVLLGLWELGKFIVRRRNPAPSPT
jgi:Ca2+-transporting ATPase